LAYTIFLGGNPISRLSTKQKTMAQSSTGTEYRAIAIEIIWQSHLLIELHIPLHSPPKQL